MTVSFSETNIARLVANTSRGGLHTVIYSRVMTMRSNNHVHAIGSRVRSRARYINLPWKIRTVHFPGGTLVIRTRALFPSHQSEYESATIHLVSLLSHSHSRCSSLTSI